jgi:hypothetical protein
MGSIRRNNTIYGELVNFQKKLETMYIAKQEVHLAYLSQIDYPVQDLKSSYKLEKMITKLETYLVKDLSASHHLSLVFCRFLQYALPHTGKY